MGLNVPAEPLAGSGGLGGSDGGTEDRARFLLYRSSMAGGLNG